MKARRAPRPLDESKLEELALRYVGRFATTRAKLRAYLTRKLRERGWDGVRPADCEALAERFARVGYVDDAAYAASKSRALTARGYGERRVSQALRIAGIAEEDGEEARKHASAEAVTSALRFAQRRRIGPFAEAEHDVRQREKAISAMVRAGHQFSLARAIAGLPPNAAIDADELAERLRLTDM